MKHFYTPNSCEERVLTRLQELDAFLRSDAPDAKKLFVYNYLTKHLTEKIADMQESREYILHEVRAGRLFNHGFRG